MKKNYLLTLMAVTVLSFGNLQGQVVNGNFETIKENGLISNWNTNLALPFSIDLETQEPVQNSVTFGCWPGFVFPTWDAHRGLTAMQITNGWDMNTQVIYPGKSIIFNDATQDFPGWNPGVPVTENDDVTMLGFYYKFFPMGNDVAEAKLVLFNEEGMEIGTAKASISQMSNNYSYLYTPVQRTASGTPTSMQISFSMAEEGSTPNFGSTLYIDDVIVNFAALANDQFNTTQFAIFPTAAEREINIVKGNQAQSGQYDFTITNTEGRIVSRQSLNLTDNNPVNIDVSQLAKGVYMISAKGFSAKFIKK
ncbi:T9SS type A sorting domain-containing protein [Flavobacterium sp. CYK-4]|uniref:T9SS type A sorting domain-containing protein n=1 Tax=Flavobacterium lotistagni TaxID=2709660 RepID=UPI00140DD251|nr:T9SS type A sorting domain-containing protein [Flavobacterium lotistagni]NHM06154.1 T9SS type A sorting domain-containing protein [Flavobacterium lotistagni]